VCCVLCAVCCVLCAVCCVLCAVCCVLCAVCCCVLSCAVVCCSLIACCEIYILYISWKIQNYLLLGSLYSSIPFSPLLTPGHLVSSTRYSTLSGFWSCTHSCSLAGLGNSFFCHLDRRCCALHFRFSFRFGMRLLQPPLSLPSDRFFLLLGWSGGGRRTHFQRPANITVDTLSYRLASKCLNWCWRNTYQWCSRGHGCCRRCRRRTEHNGLE